ncbi:sensor domain-containing diguanylate cyclase, partial [Selenomonas sp.]|uniref:sensor domain-containing diguanylate cyclase n=1 Tax=Selenomonas sp. TaxID=2053611 RepID=UPI002A81D1DB
MGKQGRTPRVPLSQTLKRCKNLFDLIKRTTDEYVLIVDIETNVAMLSPNLVQDFGLPAEVVEDFLGLWSPLVHPDERAQLKTSLGAVMEKLNVFEHAMEYRVRDAKGNYVWIRSRGRVGAMGPEGKYPIFVSMIQRMGQRNQADDVTGLLNKYQFEHNIKMALSAYRITGVGGAVMVVGIDNFKIVNETFNRMMGDVVLRNVANVIGALLPEELTLFKLDGDEFGIIYPEADTTTMTTLYSGIQKALTRPIDLEGHPYFCTVSAGTAFYPQAGKDYLVLHKHAEAA